jgi:drug/metabolite transporter (DMT)-like permease
MIKLVSTGGLVASFYRLWFAIPLLWVLPAAFPAMRQRLTREWLSASLVGGSLFAVHQVLFFTSLKLTTVADVALIGALQPPLVLVVAGRMFGETVTRRAIVWSAVAVGGTVLVVLGRPARRVERLRRCDRGRQPARLHRLLSGLETHPRPRRSDRVSHRHDHRRGLIMLVIALLTGQPLGAPRGADWAILFGLAVLPGTLGHFLTNWAHPHTSAFVVSIMFLAVPVIACAGAALFLGETLNALQLLGGAIVLAAVGVVVATARPAAGEELAESAAETDAP